MHLLIKKLHPDAIVPKYALPGDAGMDFFSYIDCTIAPGERIAIPTGIAMALPPNHTGLIWDKSGPPFKTGLHVMGGVFDETYRGEWKILLINLGKDPVTIVKGQKIAQVLIQPIVYVQTKEVDELDQTVRGSGGFGSTGLHN